MMGDIVGENVNVDFQSEVYHVVRYLGIPYAKAPVGDPRFRRPRSVEPFSGTFNATKFGAVCLQNEYSTISKVPGVEKSEDCLYLNVYVPIQDPDQSTGHAVMVSTPGGGWVMGGGSLTYGETLASVDNVIVVTINYRLGLFGFLDMDDGRIPGNMGLLDQHQALLWIHEHIKSFGGDTNHVTILGESAGGCSVALQMLYPPNEGLFWVGIAS